MTGALASLDSEGFSQTFDGLSSTEFSNDLRLAASTLPRDHVRHGCCLDPDPRTGRGVRALMGWGRELDRETGELRRTGGVLVFARRCETWGCFCCATQLRRAGTRRAFKGMACPGRVFMMTLTIDPQDRRWRAFRDAELHKAADRLQSGRLATTEPWSDYWRRAVTRASLRYVAKCWNSMATSMRKSPTLAGWLETDPATGKSVVPFMRTAELQKNGRAHLHVSIRVPSLEEGFGKRRFFRELAVASGFGGDATKGRGMGFDFDAARSKAELARYMTKGVGLAGYMAKASDLMPRHTRRFSYSRAWCEWAPKTPLAGWWDWRLAGGSPETVTRALVASGYLVDDPARYRVRNAAPPGGLAVEVPRPC